MTFLSLKLSDPAGGNEPLPRPSTPLPRVWPGFLLALALLMVVMVQIVFDPSTADESFTFLSVLTWLACFAYWLYCVYRLHRVLAEATEGRHPIPPARSV